jgi:hypothetical protein
VSLFQVNAVAEDHRAIERQAWLGTVPPTNSMIAWSYVRRPLRELRLFTTADLACSRSGERQNALGCFFLFFVCACDLDIGDSLQVRRRQLRRIRAT